MLLFIVGISFLLPIYSQVTIGSGFEPRKGSLLELKEDNNTGENSNKGFSLPRVQLTSPTVLQVDSDTKRLEYKGITVYNTGTQNGLVEGTYQWDGAKWMQMVAVESYGTDGQMLTSKGDGTYDWSTVTFPDYSFHITTQFGAFEQGKTTLHNYNYSDLTAQTGSKPNSKKPRNGLFNNDYVYKEILNVKSDATKEKYLLMALTGLTSKKTKLNAVVDNGYWEEINIYVYVDGLVKKTYKRAYSVPAGGTAQLFIDLFSIIPLGKLPAGTHDLWIQLTIGENILHANSPNPPTPPPGNFDTGSGTNFCTLQLTDINYVLYEED